MRKKQFTLIEIMIVAAIIALLAIIALPNFKKSRDSARSSTCIGNLKQIFSAKQQWAMTHNRFDGDTCTGNDINDYFIGGYNRISCPSGGTYTIQNVGVTPTCGVTGHVIP